MFRMLQSLILLLAALSLVSCAGREQAGYEGPSYAPTSRVAYAFLADQVPKPCRVFAHVLATLPADATGKSIRDAVSREAMSRGADMILIGQSRQMEEDEGLNFVYYGPEREYLCTEKWCGWKYGYDAWEEQGDWVNIGFREWGNERIRYDYPIMMQVAFLRCR